MKNKTKFILAAVFIMVIIVSMFLSVAKLSIFAGDPPPSWDWRDYGIMTSVKNQRSEGYCIAYAVIGAFEADIRLHGGDNTDDHPNFSEVDLYTNVSNLNGGIVTFSKLLSYLHNYGVPELSTGAIYKVSSWGELSYIQGNTSLIKTTLVNSGALIDGITAYNDLVVGYKPSFDNYGVYHHDAGSGVAGGHAFVIVGYRDNENCWIIKNSWGSTWNGDGYFKMAYLDDAPFGIEYSGIYYINGFTTSSSENVVGATFRLAIQSSPSGTGTVTPSGGIYNSGTIVTISATPSSGYAFDRWTGDLTGSQNPTSLTMNENKDITAVFAPAQTVSFGSSDSQYKLTVNVVGGGDVAVPSDTNYVYGEKVTLTATPKTGWKFNGWSGDISDNNLATAITITKNMTVQASFVKVNSSWQDKLLQPIERTLESRFWWFPLWVYVIVALFVILIVVAATR